MCQHSDGTETFHLPAHELSGVQFMVDGVVAARKMGKFNRIEAARNHNANRTKIVDL